MPPSTIELASTNSIERVVFVQARLVGLTLQHTNRELTLVKDQQAHAAEVTSSHRGVCGARPRKMMTDDVVRALRGHTSAEDVGPVGVEPTLART